MPEKKKKRSSRNFRIPTRVTLSTVVAIVLPVLIVTVFSSVFLSTLPNIFNFATVTTDSYSMLNQIQWSQTMSEISNELVSDDSEDEKTVAITRFVAPLEKVGAMIYIERDGAPLYATTDPETIDRLANSIVSVDKERNMNYFAENGIVIVTHATSKPHHYLVIVANDNYRVSDISQRYNAQNFQDLILGKTGLILLLIVSVFILSILLLSFLTSRTISKPIRLLADGANEIANGNLDYVIDYESTNEIGITVKAFNDMTKRLNSSIEELQKIDASRKEMVAGVAHDLRTPLTSVKGYVEGLRDGIATTDEMKESYLQTIYSSTLDMENLLDELLTLSRLELGNIQLECEAVNINTFLDEYCAELATHLRTEGFTFDYINQNTDHDITVSLDTDRFVRVMSNIVSNSVKYSRKCVQGHIELSLQEYERSVIISIADNGIGIEKENLPRIFDSFFRADQARTRVHEGSGIGLAVCKQIVELHGGRIWATSVPDEGTTVHISLDKII